MTRVQPPLGLWEQIITTCTKMQAQRRNARVNRVMFNEGLFWVLDLCCIYRSLALLFFICLLGKLTIPRSIQCSKPVHTN